MSDRPSPVSAVPEDARLSFARKTAYGFGDFTINTVLASLSLVYTLFFLTEYAELRPALAGLVPLIGRVVDAFTDPLMGRISDQTRWKAGRRRPYFLLGFLPFGVSFAMLWAPAPFEDQFARFLHYTGWYVLLSLSMTMLAVPYLSLIPEMARSYDARTSLNVFRSIGSIFGTFAAIAVRPVAEALGGGSLSVEAFTWLGIVYGVMVALPWLVVWYGTWERPDYQQRDASLSFREGLQALVRHKSYMQLVGLYLMSRIAMDLIGVVLILYYTHVIGRSGDFEITMGLFIVATMVATPVWFKVSQRMDKATAFQIGATWWALGTLGFWFATPEWPRWVLLALAPVIGFGYAAADLMPWSMVADVVDEDDLENGERREGLYNGFFTFLRKLGGASAAFIAGLVLDLAGLPAGRDAVAPDSALTAIRLLASVGTAALIFAGVWMASGYPLTRERHGEILGELERRNAKS